MTGIYGLDWIFPQDPHSTRYHMHKETNHLQERNETQEEKTWGKKNKGGARN